MIPRAPESVEAGKAEIRAAIGAARHAVSRDQAAAAGEAIAQRVAACPEYERAERIVLYAAMEDEIPTGSLFGRARGDGKCCLFPRCVGQDELVFARVDALAELRDGQFGILEPDPAQEAVFPGPRDLVLVPGVAFDRNGGRLGRGRGFYDRAFPVTSGVGPCLFGFGYSLQLIDCVPMAAHDRRMDAVATELEILRPGREEVAP